MEADRSETEPRAGPTGFPVTFCFVDDSNREIPGTRYGATCCAVPRVGEVVALPGGVGGVTAVVYHGLVGTRDASRQEIVVGLR